MYEDKTFESILNSMLSRVPNELDTREGSIIYNAIAPVAFELAQAYFTLSNYIDLFYADTAVDEYLDLKASDYGITRKAATSSVRKIETTGPVPIGSRWGLQETTYAVTELISENIYNAICEQPGEIGNAYSGALDNIDNVSGVSATLSTIIISGTNVESDDNLRIRIKQYLINPAQDGNTAQYLKWATEYPGVGAAKVFPLWNGGNTVKVAITNGLFQPAELELVNEIQEYLDPNSEGLGNGMAPIGCKVTVTGGTRKDINLTANIMLQEGYTEPIGVADAISDYLASITYVKNSVSYMRIGSALLDCPSIAEVSGLKINAGVTDVVLVGDEIPILSSLNLTVVS